MCHCGLPPSFVKQICKIIPDAAVPAGLLRPVVALLRPVVVLVVGGARVGEGEVGRSRRRRHRRRRVHLGKKGEGNQKGRRRDRGAIQR